VQIGETAGPEILTMAGSKKVKSKGPKKSKRTLARPAKPAPAKKHAPKKAPSKKHAAKRAASKKPMPHKPRAPAPKGFADRVHGAESGTGVWFITAGSVEHAAIVRQGVDGTLVIRTDAGAIEVVASNNLFETADEARAARYR
jgi:hypothetical protein